MLIKFSEIPDEGLDLTYRPGEVVLETEGLWEACAPIEARIRLEKRGEGVMASGAVSTVIGLLCSRCSEPFSLPVHEAFQVLLTPPSPSPGEEIELRAEDLDIEFLPGDQIDIPNLIRQSILLTLPLQPLCRVECRGLCVRCGANLNEGPCGCSPERIDPRFEGLRKLFER